MCVHPLKSYVKTNRTHLDCVHFISGVLETCMFCTSIRCFALNRMYAIDLNIRKLYAKHIIALRVKHLPVENILLMYKHNHVGE